MAEKRMFARTIVTSGRFLRMPAEAQLLYFQLGMIADDDGIAEAYSVMNVLKSKDEDLKLLQDKGYIKILNNDLVVQIMDWATNNKIRKDRYRESIYKDLIDQPTDNQMATECQPTDNQMATECQPTDNQMATQVRLGKDRLGKDSIAAATRARARGSDILTFYTNNIRPISSEVESERICTLEKEYGSEWVKEAIKEAALNHATSIRYIEAILNRWKSTGHPRPWEQNNHSKQNQSAQSAQEGHEKTMEILKKGVFSFDG